MSRTDDLEQALAEAMCVRHAQDMEMQPEPADPYDYDHRLQRWASVLGSRIVSRWPKPGYVVVRLK